MFKKPVNPSRVVMLLSNPYNPDDRVRNEALALQDVGYEVIVLAWDRQSLYPEKQEIDGLKIRRAHLRSEYEKGVKQWLAFIRVWIWFVQEITELSPKVVHCHDFDTYLAGLWYCVNKQDVKLVFDAHENYALMIKEFVSATAGLVVHVLEQLSIHFSDLTIAPCGATLNYYSQMGAKKTVVVGNWKDPKIYSFSVELLAKKRRELKINNRVVITYIGALSSERCVIPLIEAVKERDQIFLILGGRGIQDNDIRNVIANVDNVFFPGYIPPDDVPLFTALSDIIYYGYQVDHLYGPFNAPNKLYEALAAGKAVLASDLGGELSNVVGEVNCGLLLSDLTCASIGKAIDTLAKESIRIPMQHRALRAGLEIYNLDIARHHLQKAYAELVA